MIYETVEHVIRAIKIVFVGTFSRGHSECGPVIFWVSKVIMVVSCESKRSLLLCTLKVLLTCAVCCDVSVCMMMVVCLVLSCVASVV